MELFNDWRGRGYDDSVPGEVTKTASSGDRTTGSSTWSASLLRIYSTHSTRELVRYVPGRGYFRTVPSQNGDKLVSSPLPRPIVGRVGGISILKQRDSGLFVVVGCFSFHRGAAGDSNVLSDARVKNRSKTSRRSPAKKLPPRHPKSSTSKYYQTYPVLPHGLLSRKTNEKNGSKGLRVW